MGCRRPASLCKAPNSTAGVGRVLVLSWAALPFSSMWSHTSEHPDFSLTIRKPRHYYRWVNKYLDYYSILHALINVTQFPSAAFLLVSEIKSVLSLQLWSPDSEPHQNTTACWRTARNSSSSVASTLFNGQGRWAKIRANHSVCNKLVFRLEQEEKEQLETFIFP